jgi:hypothetical protein
MGSGFQNILVYFDARAAPEIFNLFVGPFKVSCFF